MYRIILIMVGLISSNIGLARDGFTCPVGQEFSFAYMGSSVQIRHMNYRTNYGHNFLRRNLPGINIYAGINLSRNVSLEAGYEHSIVRKRFALLRESEVIAAAPVPKTLDFSLFSGKIKIQGPYIQMVRIVSQEDDNPQFFWSFGLSFLKGRAERRIICTNDVAHNCPARILSEDKLIPRISIGVKHMVTPSFGGRASIIWQNTSKMTFYPSDERCSLYYPEIKPKDSLIFGLGLFWVF